MSSKFGINNLIEFKKEVQEDIIVLSNDGHIGYLDKKKQFENLVALEYTIDDVIRTYNSYLLSPVSYPKEIYLEKLRFLRKLIRSANGISSSVDDSDLHKVVEVE